MHQSADRVSAVPERVCDLVGNHDDETSRGARAAQRMAQDQGANRVRIVSGERHIRLVHH